MPEANLNLSQCDREPIRLIGSIQGHGFFVAFRFLDRTIYHVSENIEKIVQSTPEQALNSSLEKIFPTSFVEKTLEVASRLGDKEFEYVSSRVNSSEDIYEILIYKWDGLVALEFEKDESQRASSSSFAKAIRNNQHFVEDFHSCKNLKDAAGLICRSIRKMTDFDRVMLYRYLPNWDGEVIAEDKVSEMHSFLNHRFPATDIPLPARQLYLENRTRQIVDSSALPVAIKPQVHYITHKALDLTHSKLRAVSPIHLEYLRNMGVQSSFSVGVIVEGRLWGLIACHGLKEKVIPHDVRISCETLTSTFAVFANMMESLQTNSQRLAFDERMRKIFQDLRLSVDPVKLLFRNHSVIDELFRSSGVALVTRDSAEIAGITLPIENTKKLASLLRERFKTETKTIIAIESLAALDSEFKTFAPLASGALALYSPDNDESVFIIFRGEVLRTSIWGGDPRKTLEKRNYQGQINPRTSFETWSETISGFSNPWLPYELQGAEFLRDFVFDGLLRKEFLIKELGSQIHQLKGPRG